MLRFSVGDEVQLAPVMYDCLPHLFGRPGHVVKISHHHKLLPYRVVWETLAEDYDEVGMPKTWGFTDDELEKYYPH